MCADGDSHEARDKMNALEHAVYKLKNATIQRYPFPHFFVENVFPEEFYSHLIGNLPTDYQPLGSYKSRQFSDTMPDFMEGFKSSYFANAVLSMFSKDFYERFPDSSRPKLTTDWRFIRDSQDYHIGPHTDAPHKVVSLLFYLPDSFKDYDTGTGIYVPDDHKQICPGGPHYKFDGFSEVWRAPFHPNSVFGFWKTSNSWHAVEEISREIERNVLLFNVYEAK